MALGPVGIGVSTVSRRIIGGRWRPSEVVAVDDIATSES